MKKITFLINSLTQGGAEKIAISLYKLFENDGIKINFTTITNIDFYNEPIVKEVINNKEKISKFEKIMSLSKFFFNKKDVVLCFSLDLACYMLFLKTIGIFKGVVICRFINNPDKELDSSIYSLIKKKILIYTLKKCTRVICQSDGMRDILINTYNFPAFKTKRIYNPVAMSIEKNEQCLSNNTYKLLYVGRLTAQKNLDDLVKIASKLKGQNIDFKLKVVGDGELYSNFKSLITANRLSKEIELCGSSSNISEYYNWADMTLLVSHYEGLPNVLLESIAHRTPCVSYDCPTGPAEIIKNNQNGILVAMYDLNRFVQSVIDLRKLNLKNKNLNKTIEQFKEDRIYIDYYNLFLEVLEN